MRFELGAVRHINRSRRDVVDGGEIVIAERAEIRLCSLNSPSPGVSEASVNRSGTRSASFWNMRPVIRPNRRRIDPRLKIGLGRPRSWQRNRGFGGCRGPLGLVRRASRNWPASWLSMCPNSASKSERANA